MSKTTISIHPGEPDRTGGISQKSGREWSKTTQRATFENDRERRDILIEVPPKTTPYAPGVYSIDIDRSLMVGRYGDLEMSRYPVLVRVGDLPKARAA